MTDIHNGRPAARRGPGRRRALILLPLALVIAALLVVAGCGGNGQSGDTAAPVYATQAPEVTTDTGGRLQLAETYFDAGTVKTGEVAQHVFELKNTGTGPLYLAGKVSVKKLQGC